jgi:hypothetical protein
LTTFISLIPYNNNVDWSIYNFQNTRSFICKYGHAVSQLVEALRYVYEAEGHDIDSRWCHWNFHWNNLSCHTMNLELNQFLTEMSTRNISCRWSWAVRRAKNFTTFLCWLFRKLEASNSWNIRGLSRTVMGFPTLFLYPFYL